MQTQSYIKRKNLLLKSVIRGLRKCPSLVEKEKFKRGWTPYNTNPAWVASKPNGKAFHRQDKAEVRAARDSKRERERRWRARTRPKCSAHTT
jgi:hypothetical protein